MPAPGPIGLPARAALDAAGLQVAHVPIALAELSDPFLHDTVQRLRPAPALAHVPMAELGRVDDGAAPAGVIFHVARCGSTLASQLLKIDGAFAVYSEPLVINEILVPPHTVPRAVIVAALRSLGAMFAAHAGRPYVLKLTSWNTLFCDLVAEAFPGTPWALCIRDPLEVCVSLQQGRPGWLKGDTAARFDSLVDPRHAARTDDERLARVYAALCEAAGRLDPARGLLVPYAALPGAIGNELAPHFGRPLDDAARARLVAAAGAYAKAPIGRPAAFVPDEARKRAAASADLRRAVDALARPAWLRLTGRLQPSTGADAPP
jgi:hypothetical protein